MFSFNCNHPAARAARSVGAALLLSLGPCAFTFAAFGAEPVSASPSEQQLKAAFIYNFAKFVEWPATKAGAAATFDLCIGGSEQFAVAHQYLTGKTVRGRRVEVRSVYSAAEVAGCHLLFVSAQSHQLERALEDVHGPVLTVGESGKFIPNGGMINIVREDDRLRFEIERSAGERVGLRFSSHLLKLATLVAAER